MKHLVFGPHGRLLFRSYLILATALVVVATVLDFGFDRLQPAESLEQDPWLSATLELIETELVAVSDDDSVRRLKGEDRPLNNETDRYTANYCVFRRPAPAKIARTLAFSSASNVLNSS